MERNAFIGVMSTIILCMIVRMAIDMNLFGRIGKDSKTRTYELAVECSFFILASICLIIIYPKFTKCAKAYISPDE